MKIRYRYSSSIFYLYIFLVLSIFLAGIQKPQFERTFKSKKCILDYKYVVNNDSTFLYGRLREKRSKEPIFNMNIMVEGHRIGTVPEPDGEFRIYLPEKMGTIFFDKMGFATFRFSYAVN